MKPTILIFALLLTACPAKAPRPKPVKWEYHATFAVDVMIKPTFDALGQSRWEAVWCRRSYAPGSEKTWGYECLFKRRVE